LPLVATAKRRSQEIHEKKRVLPPEKLLIRDEGINYG